MEQRMAAVEKFTSEQGKWNSEIRAEILGLKKGMLELKEMLQDLKKGDRRSEGGESSENGDERGEEQSRQDN